LVMRAAVETVLDDRGLEPTFMAMMGTHGE
jgi:hypothetical protein